MSIKATQPEDNAVKPTEDVVERMKAILFSGRIVDTFMVHDLYRAALATPSPQPAVEPTDAMVQAYLDAQRAAVEEADKFGRPNIGGLHRNTVREACRAGLRAAIAAKAEPAEAKTAAVDGMTDAKRLDWLTAELVDTIYLDDGRIIDVGTGRIGGRDTSISPHDVRAAIDAAIATQEGSAAAKQVGGTP